MKVPCDWLIKATWKSRKWCQSFLSKALRIRKKRIDEINMKKTTGKEVIRTPLVSHPNTVMWLGVCFGKTKTMPYYSRKILNGKFYLLRLEMQGMFWLSKFVFDQQINLPETQPLCSVFWKSSENAKQFGHLRLIKAKAKASSSTTLASLMRTVRSLLGRL